MQVLCRNMVFQVIKLVETILSIPTAHEIVDAELTLRIRVNGALAETYTFNSNCQIVNCAGNKYSLEIKKTDGVPKLENCVNNTPPNASM
jgi:hypothetical protein